MALTVDDIVNKRVRILLRDVDDGGIQWKDSELITWFNDACGEVARLRPESSSATEDVPTSAGSRQAVPDGGSMLLEVICNQVSGVPGRAVRRVDRHMLDNEDPEWLTAPQTDTAFRYVPSMTDPRTFYTYPPSTGSSNAGLSIVYAKPPTVVTDVSDTCPLPDMYAAILVNYICFRAFQKQIESTAAQNRAAEFLALFNAQVGDTDRNMEQRNAKSRQPMNPAQ